MLRNLDDDLWVADHDLTMPGGIAIGTRTTLVRLSDGGLFMHSPGPLSPELVDSINALGPVRHIVAPNDFHHLYVEENAKAWPEARIHVSAGLPAKRVDLAAAEVLGDEVPGEWAADLEQVWMRGAPRVNEVVFYHPRSRTLVVTDLAFNLAQGGSFMVRLFLRLNGVAGRFTASRFMKLMYRDRAAAGESARRVFAWDFDRVILTHGEVVDTGAKKRLEPEFAWLLAS
ncbi:MAG: DUF4336 domain-containing protein [Myxococcota bacterium]|nr:DUF4336 domain-containing protein [Myxococcota bacterium]